MLKEEPTGLADGLDLGGVEKDDPNSHCFTHQQNGRLSWNENSVTYFEHAKLWDSIRNPMEVSMKVRVFKSKALGRDQSWANECGLILERLHRTLTFPFLSAGSPLLFRFHFKDLLLSETSHYFLHEGISSHSCAHWIQNFLKPNIIALHLVTCAISVISFRLRFYEDMVVSVSSPLCFCSPFIVISHLIYTEWTPYWKMYPSLPGMEEPWWISRAGNSTVQNDH